MYVYVLYVCTYTFTYMHMHLYILTYAHTCLHAYTQTRMCIYTEKPKLDACNGHWGPVPASTLYGVDIPASDCVYHYHTSVDAPFTVGCFGPGTRLIVCIPIMHVDACIHRTHTRMHISAQAHRDTHTQTRRHNQIHTRTNMHIQA